MSPAAPHSIHPDDEPPAARVKASMVLAKEIVEAIRERGMRPGDRYLPEAEALAAHRVGRGTYREALRFLEHMGVVTARAGPGGGAEVRRPDAGIVASVLALWLEFSDAPLRSILEARTAIEPGVASLVAQQATDADLIAMSAALDEAESQLGSYRQFQRAYLRFWDTFAASTHNPLLALLSPALRQIVNSAGFAPDEPYRLELLQRLRGLLATLTERDGAAAAAVMTELENEFNRRLNTGYPRQVERIVPWSAVAGRA